MILTLKWRASCRRAGTQESPHRALPVIALTAHAMTGHCERALQAGFDGYITKPIDTRSFPDQVRRALNGEGVTT